MLVFGDAHQAGIFRQRQRVKYKTHIMSSWLSNWIIRRQRGRTELRKTKREWQTYIGKNLRLWIGNCC